MHSYELHGAVELLQHNPTSIYCLSDLFAKSIAGHISPSCAELVEHIIGFHFATLLTPKNHGADINNRRLNKSRFNRAPWSLLC